MTIAIGRNRFGLFFSGFGSRGGAKRRVTEAVASLAPEFEGASDLEVLHAVERRLDSADLHRRQALTLLYGGARVR